MRDKQEQAGGHTEEALVERIARASQTRDLIRELTFLAEELGKVGESQLVRRTLKPLLQHESPVVREGAILGLHDHVDEEIEKALVCIAAGDPSPAVRDTAQDVLSDFTEK